MKGSLLNRKRNVTLKCAYVVALIVIPGMVAGCTLREAVIDGFLGGISSVVSTIVEERVLGLP